jgi:hypothetical protein
VAGLSFASTHSVLIGVDATGEFPWHLREGEALPSGSVRWRLVAQTDHEEEAVRIMDVVARRCRERSEAARSKVGPHVASLPPAGRMQ